MNLDTLLANGEATDEAVVEYLVANYRTGLFRLAASILRDVDDAEDAVQDTILTAALKIDQYRAGSNLKAWLYTICVNHCRMQLRRQKRRRNRLEQQFRLARREPGTPTPEQMSIRSEANAALWEAVGRLNEKHRLTVILRYAHNLPTGEIAEILQISDGTVRSRLHYAHRKLHRLLTESTP